MKSKSAILAVMAMFSGMEIMNTQQGRHWGPEESPQIKKSIPNGCKEFCIDGKTIIASNYKNALRKANKK